MMYDCIIIGGGPAGLSAALVLGRANRTVLILDHHRPRNRFTTYSHGFLTRDGIEVEQFRQTAYEEIMHYPSVTIKNHEVIHARKNDQSFVIVTLDKEVFEGRKIIVSTGIRERLPQIKGLASLYGKSVHNCFYCDGWELREKKIAVLYDHLGSLHLIKLIHQITKHIVVCTNGFPIDSRTRDQLQSKQILIIDFPIKELVGEAGSLSAILFTNGRTERVDSLFVSPRWEHNGTILYGLGCKKDVNGRVVRDIHNRTTIFGVYATGDAAFISPSQVAIAVGDGSRTAITVSGDLANEDFK